MKSVCTKSFQRVDAFTFRREYTNRTMSNTLINSALIALLCMLPKSTLPLCNRDAYSVSNESHADRFIKSVVYPEHFQGTHFANKFIEPFESVLHSRGRRDAEQQTNQTSLVFVVDVSATTKGNFVQLQKGVKLITNELSQRADSSIYNYIFVPYTEILSELSK